MSSIYLIYSLLLTVGLILFSPKFLLDAIRHGKYIAGIKERLGSVESVISKSKVIWIHCVSVGETQAARPLIQALLKQYPDYTFVISTTTATGQAIAKNAFASNMASIFYFPFDWTWTIRRTLNRIRPNLVLIMETELWPNFLRECHRKKIPVALVNGRISEGSFRGYKRFKWFISRVVNNLSLAIMQTEEDARRMLALGLSSKRVLVSGNVKFDFDLSVGEQTEYFKERFDLESKRPLIIAASTHAPEEYILIEALKKTFVYHDGLHPRLLIAPRHPERFNEVASMLMTSGLIWVRRSEPLCVEDKTCDVVLLDTIGEIRSVYQLAELVFVGGSIANKGGHNILEPAAAARCTITGAHTYNFSAIVNSFLKSDAVIQLPSLTETEAIEALSKLFAELLTDDHRRNSIGFRAKTVLENNNGASFRTVKMLAPLLTFDELPSKRPAA